jgi:hypothetical protein
MGFSKEFEIIGADLTWPSDAADGPSSFAIRLQQWITPFDAAPSYPLPIMHVGIQRLVLLSSTTGDKTMAGITSMLQGQGIRMVSAGATVLPDAPSGIMLWEGPEGIFLETDGLVGDTNQGS